jgi:streptogramin lyase
MGHMPHAPAADTAIAPRSPRVIRFRLALAAACLAVLLLPRAVLAAPTVTSVSLVSPSTSNPVGGGAFVQITGTGFVTGATVTFGGVPATAVQVTSATLIKCHTPPHPFGFVTVTVTNPDTTTASLANAIQYASSGTPPPASIGDFAIPTANSQPSAITAGSDGSLWFIESATNKIARNTTSVVPSYHEFTIPTANSNPNGITAGPDGKLWFTEGAGKIGTLSTAGIFNEFTLPTGDNPIGITAGPDGNLWFADAGKSKIGRITPAGTVTEFPGTGTTALPAFFITAGPDGNLWFTEADVLSGTPSKIGRLTTAGVLTEFALAAGPLAIGIAAGPDGNLWFAEASHTSSRIGRITPGGMITEFPLPTMGGFPEEIAAGPDGDLWFAENGGDQLGRIDPATGTITEFPTAANGQPYGITLGTDGNLWFTELGAGKVGKARTPSPAITGFAPTSGTVGGGTAITITGTAFSPDATLTIGGTAVEAVTITPTRITARTLPHAAGTANVTITNGDSKAATLANGYRYTATAALAAPAMQAFTAGITPVAGVSGITVGPDGNVWFTEDSGDRIGRITLDGAITEFSVPTPSSRPIRIAAGPDGNLWFTERNGGKIGRITPAGAITEFATGCFDIAAGPDGNLWFTVFLGNSIGRITPSGAITYFPIGDVGTDIATGPDGNVWFTETTSNMIGTITPAGVVTEFPIPTTNSRPGGITAGPDGNVWFTETTGNKVAMITPAGAFTEFPIPAGTLNPSQIVTGPDGDLWFFVGGTKINRIDPATATPGTPGIVNIPLTGVSTLNELALGPDGNLWLTEVNSDKIGVLFIAPPILATIVPPNGSANATQAVTLTGTGFAPGVTVTFNTSACTGITVVNPTTITCTAPALPPGTVDVTATNPGGLTGKIRFTYGTPNPLPNPAAPGGAPGAPNPLPDLRGTGGTPGSPAPIPNPRP